jgi:tRNA modification GTPase
MTDTIFALATAAGRAAVAVIRVSGPAAREALAVLTHHAPRSRRAAVRTLRAPDGEILDRALVLWFPGPRSYTGEDCIELHVHGGPAVVNLVSDALARAGLRPAEPGEFTRRAFENGKLDLGQAEAVADLVDAESAAQVRQALGQLGGALGRRYEAWREALVAALGALEAAVDFPDEELPDDVADRARAPLERLLAEIRAALADEARGRRVRDGYRIAIIGAPNAGKSSLLNALVGRDAAIVTEIPGATRDVIEVPIDIAGYRVVLADMAGVRATNDPVEIEGVRRARAWAENADLRLWLVDQADSSGAWLQAAPLVGAGDVALLTKADLPTGADRPAAAAAAQSLNVVVFSISLLADELGPLRALLAARVLGDLAGAEFPAVTRQRHGTLLAEAHGHLARGIANLAHAELAAEDVRLAARALARVTGRIGADDILDRVFADFCIGK